MGNCPKGRARIFLKEFLSPVYPQNAEMYSAPQAEKSGNIVNAMKPKNAALQNNQ